MKSQFALAAVVATAQAQRLFCENFPGAANDTRSWQTVNNTIYEWYNQIDREQANINAIPVCQSTHLATFHSMINDTSALPADHLPNPLYSNNLVLANQDGITASSLQSNLTTLRDNNWTAQQNRNSQAPIVDTARMLQTRRDRVTRSVFTSGVLEHTIDWTSTKSSLNSDRSALDANTTALRTTKDNDLAAYNSANSTLTTSYNDYITKRTDVETASPSANITALIAAKESASDTYNSDLVNATRLWNVYQNSDRLWRDNVDEIAAIDYLLNTMIRDSERYATDYTNYGASKSSYAGSSIIPATPEDPIETAVLRNLNTMNSQYEADQVTDSSGNRSFARSSAFNSTVQNWKDDIRSETNYDLISYSFRVFDGWSTAYAALTDKSAATTDQANFQHWTKLKTYFIEGLDALITESRNTSETAQANLVNTTTTNFNNNQTTLDNNVITKLTDLTTAQTNLASERSRNALAIANNILYSDIVGLRTNKTAEIQQKQTDLLTATDTVQIGYLNGNITALQTDLVNLSNPSWVSTNAAAVSSELTNSNTDLATAIRNEEIAQDDYDRALQQQQQTLSQSQLTTLQNGIRSRYRTALNAATADCTAATAFKQGFQNQIDAINTQVTAKNALITAANTNISNLAGCSAGPFLDARRDRYNNEIYELNAEITQLNAALTGNETLASGSSVYGYTQGLNELLRLAEVDRATKCGLQTNITNRINSLTTIVFDGGLAGRLAPIVVNYTDWGAIGTSWSRWRASPIPYESLCVKTQADYDAQFAALNIYDAVSRANFQNCTGVTITPPSWGSTWSQQMTALDTTLNTAVSTLAGYDANITSTNNQIPIDELALQSLRARIHQLTTDYRNNIFNYNLEAETYMACDNNLPSLNAKIAALRAQIATETPKLALKYDTYWADYQSNKTTYRSDIVTQKGLFDSALSASNATLFETRGLTSSSTARRMLQSTYTTNDFDMINEIGGTDVPVSIKICVTGTDSTTYELKGMQIFYGQYNARASALAGPAHGDLSRGCSDFNITRRVQQIALYKSSPSDTVYRGINITLDTVTASSADVPIAAGLVPTTGMSQDTFTYLPTDTYQWFGFQANVDSTTNALTDTIQVASYEPIEYSRLRSFIVAYPGLLAQADTDIQAGRDGQEEWRNIAFYDDVIFSTITTKIPRVVPTNVFVVRPENVAAVQAGIDAQVATVNEEKRIAERQRANEETNERAQAASDAAAVQAAVDGWVNNIVNAHAEVLRVKAVEKRDLENQLTTLEVNHAAQMFSTRRRYRTQIMRLIGLDEEDPCDDNCLELVGLKELAEEYEIHGDEENSADGGAIAGIVIGAILLVVLMIFCIRMMMMRGKKEHALVNQSSFRSEVKV